MTYVLKTKMIQNAQIVKIRLLINRKTSINLHLLTECWIESRNSRTFLSFPPCAHSLFILNYSCFPLSLHLRKFKGEFYHYSRYINLSLRRAQLLFHNNSMFILLKVLRNCDFSYNKIDLVISSCKCNFFYLHQILPQPISKIKLTTDRYSLSSYRIPDLLEMVWGFRNRTPCHDCDNICWWLKPIKIKTKIRTILCRVYL